MKRILTLCLALAMLLPLCACGQEADYTEDEVKLYTDIVFPIAEDMGFDDVKFSYISTFKWPYHGPYVGCIFSSKKFNAASDSEKMELICNIDCVLKTIADGKTLLKDNAHYKDCESDWIIFANGTGFYTGGKGASRYLHYVTNLNDYYNTYRSVLDDNKTTVLCNAAKQILEEKGLRVTDKTSSDNSSSKSKPKKKQCEYCNGTGKILVTWYSEGDWGTKDYSSYTCTHCNGTGYR